MKTILLYLYMLLIVVGVCCDNDPIMLVLFVAAGALGLYKMRRDGLTAREFSRLSGAEWLANKMGVDLYED